MNNTDKSLCVGEVVPDFRLHTFDPAQHDFSAFDLAQQREAGGWTILFFYPADFTFV